MGCGDARAVHWPPAGGRAEWREGWLDGGRAGCGADAWHAWHAGWENVDLT